MPLNFAKQHVAKELLQAAFLKKPVFYKVIIFNDDYTPMEFVLYLLKNIFNMPHHKAINTVFKVHYKGRASCGYFDEEEALQKLKEIQEACRTNKHPLRYALEMLEY